MFCESRFSGRKPQMFINVCKTLLKLKEANGSSVHKIAQVIFSKFLQLGLKPNPQNILTQVKRAINYGLKNDIVKEKKCGQYCFKSNIPKKLLTIRNSLNLFDSNRHAYNRSLTLRRSYEQDKACKKKKRKLKRKKCKQPKKNKKKVKFCEKTKDENNQDNKKEELKYISFNPRKLNNYEKTMLNSKLLVDSKNKKPPINVSSDEFYKYKTRNKNREKLMKPWKIRKPPRPLSTSDSKGDETNYKETTLFDYFIPSRKHKKHNHLKCHCKKKNTGKIVKHKPKRKRKLFVLEKLYSKEFATNKENIEHRCKENKSSKIAFPNKCEHNDKSENNNTEYLNCSTNNENLNTQENEAYIN